VGGGGCSVLVVKKVTLLQEALSGLAFFLCLFGWHLAFSSGDAVGSACREVEAVFRNRETQWMAVLCIGTYLFVFSVIRNRRLWGGMTPHGVDLCCGAVLTISTLVYFLRYQRASQSVQAVMLLGGAVIGSGAWVNVFWRGESGSNKRSLRLFVTVVVIMLSVACFWESGFCSKYSYKQSTRWVGPCDNPNLYGLLMGAGVVLAFGLALSDTGVNVIPGLRWRFWNRLKVGLFLAAAGMICFGLWKSYSRGAWLAAGVGGLYLWVQWFMRTSHHCSLSTHHYSLAIIVGALMALMFWQYQHTESVSSHRAISATNRNDFSWRNRVSAWEGGLQMMAEKPWWGYGWNQPEPFYEHYYSASRLDETSAIQMNDYLMLGATLGIPALFCFCMYLWLSLFPGKSGQWFVVSGQKEADQTLRELAWLKAVCRAGALVLAVGFWFDGGLFKLPTAATFWILLELGRE